MLYIEKTFHIFFMPINSILYITLFLIITNQGISQSLERFEFEHQKMGTQFKVILYHQHKNSAQSIANQCFKKIDALNLIFSDYNEASEISQLSASAGSAKKIKVSLSLWTILKMSKRYARKSKGAFDITIGPLSKLWRSMFRRSEIFDGVKINFAKAKIGFHKLKFYPLSKRVKLVQKGMRLDVGGIAKGYTVDAMAAIIRQAGVKQFLVDGGGDLYIGDAPPQKTGWTIYVKTTNKKGVEMTQKLILKNTAIASSGDTYRYLEQDGKRYSHIIDPRTGYGVIDQKIVSVQATTCIKADVTASILSILNEQETKVFLKKIKKIKVF